MGDGSAITPSHHQVHATRLSCRCWTRLMNGDDEPAVYIVDDDADLGASLARFLKRHGYSAQAFTNPTPLLATQESIGPCCIITDIMMGEISGFDFVHQLRERHSVAAIILICPHRVDHVDC
ncbi:MAG: response regulator [Novosphingobium sp.]